MRNLLFCSRSGVPAKQANARLECSLAKHVALQALSMGLSLTPEKRDVEGKAHIERKEQTTILFFMHLVMMVPVLLTWHLKYQGIC